MNTTSTQRVRYLPVLIAIALSVAILLQPILTQIAGAQQADSSTDPNDFTTQGSVLFAPVTLADFGPVTTNASVPSMLAVSGDWVAYGSSHIVCGHCGYLTDTVYGQNVVTGKTVHIKGSSERLGNGDSRTGMTAIELRDALLTWTQPALPGGQLPTPGANPTDFTGGDYNCSLCYYNLATGQGGPWTGGTLPPIAPADWALQTSAYDPSAPDSHVITVTQRTTGKVAFTTTFNGGWSANNAVFDATKMLYYQTISGYAVPQLVRVAWLLPSDPAFTNVWTKADAPVASGKAARSWLWGPAPILTRPEQYSEGKNGRRLVQYYDKSRMEINDPGADPNSPGYITNGLLTVEMISGELQIGDIARVQASVPCTIPVAGDPRKDNPLTPGYSDLLSVSSIHGENQAAPRGGQPVDDALDVNGIVSKDTAHASLARYNAYVNETKHNIPDVFTSYLTSMQAAYGFDWTFVLGYPITEAYWTQMRVGGKDLPVLIQAYQRRVLTYVPGFPKTWQVQQGNVGQHYLEWHTLNRVNKLSNPDILP